MRESYRDVAVETAEPRPWEQDVSFSDLLYEWMGRAPWLAISAAAHVVILMILAAMPWDLLREDETRSITASIEQVQEAVFEEPPEEEPEPLEEEPEEEPLLQNEELAETFETPDDQDFAFAEGDPDFESAADFDTGSIDAVLGLGGAPGGNLGQRLGSRRRGPGDGSGTQEPLERALAWLARHQDEDGKWDADGFMKHDPPEDECTGPGQALHDVGMTGLALLALLGDGNTLSHGRYRQNVARGIAWLKAQQDPDTGLLCEPIGHGYLYDHAIATLALCEAFYFSKSPLLEETAQDAINLITRARNPYGAWRYEYPPNGESDTSVTGWMVFALESAKEAGLQVDPAAFDGALAWLDEMSDPASGRVGYDTTGSLSSRTPINEHFPPERGEAMTAVGLLCRFFLGQTPEEFPIMEKHAELMLQKLPAWDPQGFGTDMYYWYYGSYAMFQMGGQRYWKSWNEAMKSAVVETQIQQGSARGSWDPVGPWGTSGGRVYSTATMALCLEVYFRYAKVLGAR